ncbi:hypothetical protein EIP86_011523 [Pleurotus ostreatoroseus]|nr:hypothetical protein EIP86_011523 [Pleurotus ostreatoroseus]
MNPPATEENTSLYPLAQEAALSTGPDRAVLAQLHRRVSLLLPPLLSTQRSSWEQGVTAQALLELVAHPSGITIFPPALDYLRGLVHDALVRQGPDGRLAVLLNGDGTSDAGALDPACIGQSIFFLLSSPHLSSANPSAAVTIISRMEDGVGRMLNYILHACPKAPLSSVDSSLGELLSHRTDSVQVWSDSIILASLALQSPSGLWSHIYDLDNKEFQRKAHWGVGNGWVCCGIVRMFCILAAVIFRLGADAPLVQTLRTDPNIGIQVRRCYVILMRTFESCLLHIRPDGLFHNIIDDQSSFVEVNLSQQLSYTAYRLLEFHRNPSPLVKECFDLPAVGSEVRQRWEKMAELMRNAAMEKTDEWGFVRDVCGSPRFDAPGTAAEGQAWGVLMEVARAQYLFSKE